MALVTYNGTNFDDHLGSASITTATNVSISTGISSAGVTAPNLTNKINGCWVWFGGLPAAGDTTIAVQESGVTKVSAVIKLADVKLGANYVRFATPYQFATLTASAYTVRVTNSSNQGQLRTAASGLWFALTYDTARSLGATDDVWVGGFNDSGLTPKQYTYSGTVSWGSGQTGINSTTQSTMAAALLVGNGGTVKADQSASVQLTLAGSPYITAGGVFDMRPPSSKSITSTLILNSATLGDQVVITPTNGFGGQFLSTGASYSIYTTYTSGLGTAASPMIVGIAVDWDVNDEIVIGGGTDYTKNERKYIKTRNSSTSFVLSDTPGGAEAALVNTHAAGSHMSCLTRNSIIKPSDTAKGFWVYLGNTAVTSDMSYTRLEYADSTSGKAVTPCVNTNNNFDGVVFYGSSSGNRYLFCPGANNAASTAQTFTGIILYDTKGSNYAGQSGIGYSGTSNKTLVDSFLYNAPGSTNTCGFISLNVSSTSNTINNCHSYGANAANSSFGYAVGIFSSNANTFNNCTFNATRSSGSSPALLLSTASGTVFNYSKFGNIATNTVDISTTTSTLNTAYFNGCYFSSATLIRNYLNQLDTSIAKFQDMDGDTSKHRWYTNYGSWWSSGSGLTDTTVRTASSLSLVSKPENATTGSSWTFKIPANPTSQVGIFGYVYRNATFSSGTLKVELFLPGTLLTATPDATYTFPTTTGSWLPFNISAYYSGSVSRYAQVRITGVTATAGAYFFVDDLYDAGTGNKVAGLDLWDEGQPSQIMVQSDFSVVPSAVWGYSDSNTQANTMGQRQVDAADNAEQAAVT